MDKNILTEKLAESLKKTWNQKEFCEYFMEKNKLELFDIVEEKLKEEGYPETANCINTNFTLYCENELEFEKWAEIAKEEWLTNFDLETVRLFLSTNSDYEMYAENWKDNIVFNVVFELSVEDYKLYHPTVEKLAEIIEDDWPYVTRDASNIIKQNIREYESIFDALRDKLMDEGFGRVEISSLKHINYSLGFLSKVSYEKWAEIALERYIIETVDRFRDEELLVMILKEYEMLRPKIEILTDVYDYRQIMEEEY